MPTAADMRGRGNDGRIGASTTPAGSGAVIIVCATPASLHATAAHATTNATRQGRVMFPGVVTRA